MLMKKVTRRKVLKAGAASAALLATGCSLLPKKTKDERAVAGNITLNERNKYDFIVIGSGPGGGPLAVRLVQAGYTVLLLEAGDDKEGNFSRIPAAHGRAVDDPLLSWNYFVSRYNKQANGDCHPFDQQNSKFVQSRNGILYPRASALGGCTNVNALIHLYPDHQDWDYIMRITGDRSWGSEFMYQHFRRLRSDLKTAADVDAITKKTHVKEFEKGWLHLEQSPLSLIMKNGSSTLRRHVLAAAREEGILNEIMQKAFLEGYDIMNPNSPDYLGHKRNGLFNIPINSKNGKRTGVREFILEAKEKYKDRLFVSTNCLCKKLIFDPQNRRKVIGVEYARGSKLYQASSPENASLYDNSYLFEKSKNSSYQIEEAFVTKEVIVSGGAFNSPQILMLSGIGDQSRIPKTITPTAHVPGVGLNLQDRYEVTVVSELKKPIDIIKNCKFGDTREGNDPCKDSWENNPTGDLYSTNGVAVSWIKRSSKDKKTPDLNIFGLPGAFYGYKPNWSKEAYNSKYFSWAVLKGHTKNIAGYVALKSDDFRDTPEINFRYFFDGTQEGAEQDLNDVLAGVKAARAINDNVDDPSFLQQSLNTINNLISKPNGPLQPIIEKEVYPSKNVQSDEDLKKWIQKEAWGHHASCSNRMGNFNNDPYAVVDSKFKVRDTEGLRVVDASVFPKIPGLFILVPTLVISEKAAQAIIEEHRKA